MSRRILIIGDGLAGLATAFYLHPRSNLEIRIAPFHPYRTVPASHHGPDDSHACLSRHAPGPQEDMPLLVHGFHHETRSMLDSLHEAEIWTRSTSVLLEFLRPSHRPRAFRPFPAPAPFHTVLGLLFFQGLSLNDRWHLLTHLEGRWEGKEDTFCRDGEHRPASQWLAQWKQSAEAQRQVWDPLCRFLLGDQLATTSTAALENVLRRCFLAPRRDAHITLFSSNARDLLIAPLQHHLAAQGINPLEEAPISHLVCNADRVDGAVSQSGYTLIADNYVLALPPHHVLSCLPERLLSNFSYFGNLHDIASAPITCIQLRFLDTFMRPRLLLCPPPFSWIVCQTQTVDNQRQAVISCIVPEDVETEQQPDEALIQTVLAMLRFYPTLFDAELVRRRSEWRVIRNAWTWYSSRPGSSILRPLQQSPIENLSIAGGWTDTGLPPSSIESDLVSAKFCAAAVQGSVNTRVDTGTDEF